MASVNVCKESTEEKIDFFLFKCEGKRKFPEKTNSLLLILSKQKELPCLKSSMNGIDTVLQLRLHRRCEVNKRIEQIFLMAAFNALERFGCRSLALLTRSRNG